MLDGKVRDRSFFCPCAPDMPRPSRHWCSSHTSRGSNDLQNSQPVRPKPSGKKPPAALMNVCIPGGTSSTAPGQISATATVRSNGKTTRSMTAIARRLRLGAMRLASVRMGPMTWRGTYGSGWPIGMRRSTISTVQRAIRQGHPPARRWSYAVAHGSTRPLTCGRPNALGSPPTGGMRTSASGVCRGHEGRRQERYAALLAGHKTRPPKVFCMPRYPMRLAPRRRGTPSRRGPLGWGGHGTREERATMRRAMHAGVLGLVGGLGLGSLWPGPVRALAPRVAVSPLLCPAVRGAGVVFSQ